MSYLPNPPRAWSRVEGNVNCISPIVPPFGNYTVYVPLTKQTIPLAIAAYQEKVIYKGNILQYKNNSSNLSKKQIYSKIANRKWVNNKSYATQSLTYTNPNKNSLYRANASSISTQNETIGEVGNPAGPYGDIYYNPFNCITDTIDQGGSLICGTLANPCTNQLIKSTKSQNCSLITSSNVPGFRVPGISKILCWNKKLSVYIPRQRRVMSNSGTKWPVNYKEFVSSLSPLPPILEITSSTEKSVTLNWKYKNNECIPVSNFYVYQNNSFIKKLSVKQITFTIDNLSPNLYTFYITSLSNTIQSTPSNKTSILIS
jgi:hypothetical protein